VTPLGRNCSWNALDLKERVVRDITTPRGECQFFSTPKIL